MSTSSGNSPPAPPANGRFDTAMVRQANLQSVVRVLRDHGPMSRAHLVRRLGLTRPTVLAIVNELLAADTVVETGTDRRPAQGRPGRMLAFNAVGRFVAACVILDTAIEVALADADGVILDQLAVAADHRSPQVTFRQMTDAVLELSARCGGHQKLGATGVIIPGIIDPISGVCRYSAPLGWRNVAVGSPLADLLQTPVVTLNPAHATALGEFVYGNHHSHNLVVIRLDRGIGAGLISGGQLVTGAAGMAGTEIGHVRVVESGVRCICGRDGCLATVASGRRIVENAATILGSPVPEHMSLADLENVTPEVDAMLGEAARWLGVAASWLINALAPDVLVLGGSTFGVGHRFFEEFAREARRRSLLPNDTLRIVASELGGHSDLRGALRAAQEQLPAAFAPARSLISLRGPNADAHDQAVPLTAAARA